MRSGSAERWLHLAFEAALAFKALFAVSESAAGIGAFVVKPGRLLDLASALTRKELLEDPRDLVANYVLHAAQHLSAGTQHFMGAYLLGHGAVKLALIAALLARKLWAYPLAIAVFALFIAYQLYRYGITHAPALLALTVVDLAVIALTWHEYRYLKRRPIG